MSDTSEIADIGSFFSAEDCAAALKENASTKIIVRCVIFFKPVEIKVLKTVNETKV